MKKGRYVMLDTFFRPLLAVFKKDFIIWLRNPLSIVASLGPILAILVVQGIGSGGGNAGQFVGRNPVALVTLDHATKGMQMRQILYRSNVFRLTDATPQQAQDLMKNLQAVATITIPADFTQRVQAHESTPLEVTINNLNLDFTDDIRRALPDAITQFYQAQGSRSPIKITLQEQDLRKQDIQLFQYSFLPLLVLLLISSGLVTNSIAAAREWEQQTIKELLLSPVGRLVLITGKALAGFTGTLCLGLLVFALSVWQGWIQPPIGVYLGTCLLIMVLIALLGTGLGVALGTMLQRIQLVTTTSVISAFLLFFLTGGIGVLAFEPIVLQNIAAFDPLYYGVHALQMALFYNSSDQLGRDVLVLSLSALVALILGVFAMRRRIAS
jgi:ABC-2 type transport system permease protein